MEKKLDGNYTKILRTILYKSRRQHPAKQQLYSHLPPITKWLKHDHQDMRYTLLGKLRRTHKWDTPADPFTWTSKGKTTSQNLYTASSVLTLDDHLGSLDDRDGLLVRGREICASSVTWWHDDDGNLQTWAAVLSSWHHHVP